MSKPVGGWGVLVGGIDRSMHKRTGNMDTTGKAFWEVKVMSLSPGMGWEAGVLEKKTIRNYSTQHVPCKNSVFFVSASSLNGLETQSFSLFFFPRVFLIISRLYSQLCIRHLAVGRVSVESNRIEIRANLLQMSNWRIRLDCGVSAKDRRRVSWHRNAAKEAWRRFRAVKPPAVGFR